MVRAGRWIVGGRIGASAMALGVSISLAGGVGADSMTAQQAPPIQNPAAPPKADGKSDRPADGRGRWLKLPPRPSVSHPSPEDAEMLEQLRAIGYVGGSIEDERKGVVRYRPDRATPGLNFYSSGHAPEAILMDMNGKVLHRWHASYNAAFPDQPKGGSLTKWWRRVHLLDDGSILAIFDGLGLVKLDRNSKILWARANNAHHDLEVLPNGDIYVLTRTARMDERPEGPVPILEDFLTLLDASGNEKWRFSILEVIKSTHPEFLDQGKWRKGDLSHTNTLHVLASNTAGPAFAKGNILTSMNALGLIAVLDVERRQFTWVRKTPPNGQHDPKMLDNGNILFFDNRESARASAVLEIDPSTDGVEWQYLGSAAEPFYSLYCGAAERLHNGNTLITESYGGRAFEVDRAGEIVWEFFNPHRAGEGEEYIAVISEMVRIPIHATKAWLQGQIEP